jgi:hypothetical protein
MSEALKSIPFEEFSENLTLIFDRVVSEGEEIVVETGAGKLVSLKPVTHAKPRRRTKTKEDYEAFLSSFGGWKDVDVDTFLKDNYESRRISTHPPVDL